MGLQISIVIPTYNRPEQLSDVLKYIFASETEGFESIEIIVVDDGSKKPARQMVESITPQKPFRLNYIYQENAGPAEARNRGFREASHEVVLFVDDDVLLFPDAIRKHLEAHDAQPDSVIFGPYPYLIPETITAEYRFLKELVDEGIEDLAARGRFVRVNTVASGNLSVRKRQFAGTDVYQTGLKIPVAEEYALIDSLRKRNIPIYFVHDICGWHLQPTTLTDVCTQNYKYGLGISEVAIKQPSVLDLDQLKVQFDHNKGIAADDHLKSTVKKILMSVVSRKPMRTSLRIVAEILGRSGLPDPLLFRIYRAAISSYSSAGVRDGVKMFGGANR